MARTSAGFINTNPTTLATAVNTALAALTDPTLRNVQLSVDRMQRRPGVQYRLIYSYDTGGASLGTPFLVTLIEAATMAALITAINTFVQAQSGFVAAPFLYVLDTDDQVKLPLYGAMILYNATGGASANFTPLVPG